jgi:LacI family transcriptional regulator
VFPAFVKAVQENAWASGNVVLPAGTGEDERREREVISRLLAQVDGLILCSSRLSERDLQSLAAETQLVLVNRQVDAISSVLTSAAEGIQQAMEHLVAHRHRRIGYAEGGPGHGRTPNGAS